MKSKITWTLALALFALTACETSSDDNIEKARACTDSAAKMSLTAGQESAAATQAYACEAMVAGQTSKEAAQIQFGAILIQQQKMSQIAAMARAMKTPAGGKDGMATAVSYLVLSASPTLTATQVADRLKTLSLYLSSGTQTIANLISMSTYLNVLGGTINSSDPNSVITAINNCTTAACQDAIASSVTSLQASACASEADQNSTDPNNPCVKAKAITAGATDNATIVNNLKNYLNTTH